MARNAPKSPPENPEVIVQKIQEAEKPLRELAEKLNAKNKEIYEWREAHPELGQLEQEANELFSQFKDLGGPIRDLLGKLSQLDPTRFSQELKRIREAGLQPPN